MNSMTGDEIRIRRLEELAKATKRDLANAGDKLGQVSEDNSRDQKPFFDGGPSNRPRRFQAVGDITAAAGNVLGAGTVRFIQVIDGKRYKTRPIALGDVTTAIFNDTSGRIPDLVYGVMIRVDGTYTAIVADCAAVSPTVAPDPPDPDDGG